MALIWIEGKKNWHSESATVPLYLIRFLNTIKSVMKVCGFNHMIQSQRLLDCFMSTSDTRNAYAPIFESNSPWGIIFFSFPFLPHPLSLLSCIVSCDSLWFSAFLTFCITVNWFFVRCYSGTLHFIVNKHVMSKYLVYCKQVICMPYIA